MYSSIGSEMKHVENSIDKGPIRPSSFHKMRVDSFAKTPNFLKSPRSLASSHYGGQDHQDHLDFGTLKTFADEMNGEAEELSSRRLKRKSKIS